MTPQVLLDPAVVFEAEDEKDLERLLEWTGDHRVRLGKHAWSELAERHAQGTLTTPASLMRIAYRSIGDLLSRQPMDHAGERVDSVLSVEYRGQPDQSAVLIADLVGLGMSGATFAIGTETRLWAHAAESIDCDPPPPIGVALHFDPNLPTPEERRAAHARWFKDRRLLIVGGQVDDAVKKELETALGISEDRVRWIPSEKHKRARNLDKIIKGLPANAVVICIVGKVGHDVSGEVKEGTSRRKLILCESRYASQICSDLENLAS